MAASGFMRGLRANAIALIGSDAQATRELFQLLDAGAASDYRFAKALLQGRKTLPWLRDWQEKRASDIFENEDVSCWIFLFWIWDQPSVSMNYLLLTVYSLQKKTVGCLFWDVVNNKHMDDLIFRYWSSTPMGTSYLTRDWSTRSPYTTEQCATGISTSSIGSDAAEMGPRRPRRFRRHCCRCSNFYYSGLCSS